MPDTPFETVELDETAAHPLEAALEKLSPEGRGPLMVLGLERSNPAALPQRSSLYALNLSRPEWPRQLPRPIVFWIPEYLLGLLEREAPDFLDWRSDTVFFPQAVVEIPALSSEILFPSSYLFASIEQRRKRIAELKARLAQLKDGTDRVGLDSRSRWLGELGSLLFLSGKLLEARKLHRESLNIELRYAQERKRIAEEMRALADVHDRLQELNYAESLTREALEIDLQDGFIDGQASDYGKLGHLVARQGRLEEGRDLLVRALELHRRASNDRGVAWDSLILGNVLLEQGKLEDAESLMKSALQYYEERSYEEGMVAAYNSLIRVASQRGDRTGARLLADKVSRLLAKGSQIHP